MPDQAAPLEDRSTVTTRLRRAACAAAGLLLAGALVAGCGGGSPGGGVASLGSHTSGSHSSSTSGAASASEGHEASPASQAIAYTACMHAHGVPNFPEPQVSEHGGSTSIKMAVPAASEGTPNSRPPRKPAASSCPVVGRATRPP